MANDTVTNPVGNPAPDGVLVRITGTIARDFASRGKHSHLQALSGKNYCNYVEYILSYIDAETLLLNVNAMYTEEASWSQRGLKKAYGDLVQSLKTALKEAAARPAMLASPFAVCRYASDGWELWKGTRSQILRLGVVTPEQWPETKKSSRTKDARGYETTVDRTDSPWGLLDVSIDIPEASRRSADSTEAKRATKELRDMLQSEDDFRAQVVKGLRLALWSLLKFDCDPELCSGYHLSESAAQEIMDCGLDALEAAVIDAPVSFDAEARKSKERALRARIAAADTSFQTTLATLCQGGKP